MSVDENAYLRREAEEIMDLIGERKQHFWEALAEMANAKAGKLPTPLGMPKEESAKMREQDAISFEKTLWPIKGSSQGMPVGQVSTEWICRIVDGNDFTKKLRRYVRSDRFKQRQREEEAPANLPPHLTHYSDQENSGPF